MKKITFVLAIIFLLGLTSISYAGSIFLTGHDSDFHAIQGDNFTGAQHINQVAINYVTNPLFNPFAAGGVNKFLFVESSIVPPLGHTTGMNGIIASGYTQGVNFIRADGSTLDAELDKLGTVYSAIVVASDFGGVLTSAELNILNARSSDIISFLNSGGGLFAMAESNSQAQLTTGSTLYGFLPFVVSSTQLSQLESGATVTPFGGSLGLTNTDVNGNWSHNIFLSTGGLDIVDVNPQGSILTLAGRTIIATPEPGVWLLLGLGLAGLATLRRKYVN